MKIAVTGGTGFLGGEIVAAAADRGHEVWSFDRSQGNDVLGDLAGLRDAETVIHLAGVLGTSELFDEPENAIQNNVIGSLRVLEWCRDHGAAYVGVTMLDVFPSVYTATKVCSQRLATAWHNAYDVPVSHVRAFNAYGPTQAYGSGHPQKIVPTFSRAAWENKRLPIWGDGEQTMDLVSASDVARMFMEAIHHGDDSVFDAGTGTPVTVNQLADFVIEVTGSTAGVEYLPMRKGEEPTHVVAPGSGWDRISWKPELSWQDVERVIRWYR